MKYEVIDTDTGETRAWIGRRGLAEVVAAAIRMSEGRWLIVLSEAEAARAREQLA